MADEVITNKKYKDRLFRFVFGGAWNKEYTLSLYNALNDSSYTDAEALEITTLDDVIFMHMRNDVSFLLGNNMSFIEQQSTVCGNLALRKFLYAGEVYNKHVDRFGSAIYGRKKLEIPTPTCITLYNGTEQRPAVELQRLSDSFIRPLKAPEYEWTDRIINLNHKDNAEMIKKSKPLYDYVEFVSRVQKNIRNGMNRDIAVQEAINTCISENIMADILGEFGSEVHAMCLKEFDEEGYEKVIRQESWEDGLEAGRKAGIEEGLEVGRKAGIEEGLEAGRKEGMVEGETKIALNMLVRGYPIKEVITLTSLDEELIAKLAEENGIELK